MFSVELVLALIAMITGLYHYLTKNYNYWESRGVKGPEPVLIFGTAKDLTMGKYGFPDYVTNIYKNWKDEPFVGIYLHRSPVLVINDLDLVKDVLIKDFSKFTDRGTPMFEKIEPLSAHLFNLEAARWRPLRMKLSPVFTSGKLKEMFYLLVECVENLDKYVDDIFEKSGTNEMVFECRELMAKFTTDVIGVCAFGLQMNALANEDSIFRSMGRRIFATDWKRVLQFRLRTVSPILYEMVGHLLVDREMHEFFIDTMKQTMDYRKTNNVIRHDFIDLLMAIRDHPEKMAEVELTDNILAAQLFVFFVAGFETSSTTMSHALYELARNQEIQDKLRREIREELTRIGGKMEYEWIKDMKYLDMVLNETLRKYPPVTVLFRESTDAHTFMDESSNKLLTIEKGTKIYIPVYGIQKDARHFPNPDLFDPERFTEEAIKSRHPMTDLAFGNGPRNCIGKRFGVMQSKVGLVMFLNNYRVEVCDETQIPYINNPKSIFLSPIDGIRLKIFRIGVEITRL